MKLTVATLVVAFLVFSYAGVQPMATYKDTSISYLSSLFNNLSTRITQTSDLTQTSDTIAPSVLQTTISTTPTLGTTTLPTTNSTALTLTPTNQTTTIPPTTYSGINPVTGVYGNYYIGLVKDPLAEGDSYGNFVVLIDNKNAKDPTYAQLLNFLEADKTDSYPYIYVTPVLSSYYGSPESHVDLGTIQAIIDGTKQPDPPRLCVDFAERLHNDAKMAGIRCGFVNIYLSGYTNSYGYPIPSNSGHSLDVFETSDQGLVYIDDTGIPTGTAGPSNCDKVVQVQVGETYIPQSLFPESGWNSTWDSMGTVTSMVTTWDGKWNN